MTGPRDLAGRTRRALRTFLESWAIRGTAGLSPLAAVRLRTFNLVTLAVGVLGLVLLLWLLWLGKEWSGLAWLRLPVLLWYAALPVMVMVQKRPIAQVGTLVIANASIVAMAVSAGRELGLQALLFPLVTFPLLIFEPRQYWLLATTMALPLIARVSFELVATPWAATPSRGVYVGVIVQAFLLLGLPLLAFIRETLRYQTELEDATAALRVENQLRAKAEAELEIARRTEAMGRLAAGIAHEINTPLQFVTDNVTFAATSTRQLTVLVHQLDALVRGATSRGVDADLVGAMNRAKEEADLDYVCEQLPPALERSLDGLDRLAQVVRSMKELARPDVRDKTPVDINRLITNALLVAQSEYRRVADAATELGDIPPVTCHAGEIGQVILSLVVNAGHAIAERFEGKATRGRICVRSQQEGGTVAIQVEDNGAGIAPAVATRIYEPFFTTKPVGQGTGQGLAIAHAIVVRRHGGTLDFRSEPGRGTTFIVRLPIDPPSAEPDQRRVSADAQA